MVDSDFPAGFANENLYVKLFGMKPVSIRDAIDQKPFQPFKLEMDNGKTLHVPHRDFIFLTCTGNTAVVVERAPEGEHTHIVDIEHVSMIKFGKKKAA